MACGPGNAVTRRGAADPLVKGGRPPPSGHAVQQPSVAAVAGSRSIGMVIRRGTHRRNAPCLVICPNGSGDQTGFSKTTVYRRLRLPGITATLAGAAARRIGADHPGHAAGQGGQPGQGGRSAVAPHPNAFKSNLEWFVPQPVVCLRIHRSFQVPVHRPHTPSASA